MNLLKSAVFGAALLVSTPLAAQEEAATSEEMSEDQLAEFSAMMGGLFQAEELTAEQEARLPAARSVVGAMMPDGFYAKMMDEVMSSTMAPIMGMFSGPDMVVQSKIAVDSEKFEALKESQKIEIAKIIDPAYDRRSDAMVNALTGSMSGMFSVLEEPMRDGLSRAYAVRFSDAQLADISSFFETPTGSVYATESMALFSDPQVMSAMMSSMPLIMQGMGDLEGTMEAAMAELPKERTYDDLSAAERSRIANILGITDEQLRESMQELDTEDFDLIDDEVAEEAVE